MKKELTKKFISKGLFKSSFDKKENGDVPIYRGCQSSVCFCTGKCKEIVGRIEKENGAEVFFKCSHGKFLNSFIPCQDCEKDKEKMLGSLNSYITKK